MFCHLHTDIPEYGNILWVTYSAKEFKDLGGKKMSVRVSGSDHGIPTHLSMLQSYLFSRAYPVRCSLFPVQSTSRPGTALYLRSKTPHINPPTSAMQTSGQINVNFLLALTCQEPQTEGCKPAGMGHFEQARQSKGGSSDMMASRLSET